RDVVRRRNAALALEVPVRSPRHSDHTASSSVISSLPLNDGITRSRSDGSANGAPLAASIASRVTTHRRGTSTRTYAARSSSTTCSLSLRIAAMTATDASPDSSTGPTHSERSAIADSHVDGDLAVIDADGVCVQAHGRRVDAVPGAHVVFV